MFILEQFCRSTFLKFEYNPAILKSLESLQYHYHSALNS